MLPYVRAWRFEHAQTGEGPMRNFLAGRCDTCRRYPETWGDRCGCHWPHPNPYSMPAPLADNIVRPVGTVRHMTYRDRGWLYAFRREADARTYFGPRVAHQLAAGGYVLNVYQVPWHRHAIGRINMLFDRAASRLVRTINMETYARQLAAELATLRAIQVAGDITPMTHRVAA